MSNKTFPAVPNAPLNTIADEQVFGEIELCLNTDLNFLENIRFDSNVILYNDDYQNNQSHSGTFIQHMEEISSYLKKELPNGGTVVEIGCGKGDFLELLQKQEGFKVLGFDATYEGDNPAIQKRYLNAEDNIEADLIVLRHVLEHIPHPHNFLKMVQSIFSEAKIYIEVPSYEWIIKNQTFFDITYEHVNYFSKTSLCNLFDDPELNWRACFSDQYQFIISNISLLSERFKKLYETGQWIKQDFGQLFPSLSDKIQNIKDNLSVCKNIYLWGAATKGCMFLVHTCEDKDIMERFNFAVDINPDKCGKYLPGSLKPIRTPEEFYASATNEDLLLIANPRYRKEIECDLEANGLKEIKLINL